MNTYPERIRMAMAHAGFTQEELAKRIGLTQQSVQYAQTKAKGSRFTQQIAEACGVDSRWLATGTGEMVRRRHAAEVGDMRVEDGSESETLERIPRYRTGGPERGGVRVYSGPASGCESFVRSWIDRKGLRPSDLVIIEAGGGSMAPYIMPGDLVLVDRTNTEIVDGGVYVFLVDSDPEIKRVRRNIDGSFTISGDNQTDPDGSAERLHRKELEAVSILGKVVWRGG